MSKLLLQNIVYFFLILSGCLYSQKSEIKIDKKVVDQGRLSYFSGKVDSVKITNISKSPVYIFATTKERNLEYRLPKGAIRPGESDYLYFISKPDRKGSYSHKLNIYTRSGHKEYQMKITGEIESFDPNYQQLCPSFSSKPQNNSLDLICKVLVLDDQTDLPIDGALVEILKGRNSSTKNTNRKGEIEVKIVMGLYYLNVTSTGYVSESIDHYFGRNSTTVVVRLNRAKDIEETNPYIADRLEQQDDLLDYNQSESESEEIMMINSNLNEQDEDIDDIQIVSSNLNEQSEDQLEEEEGLFIIESNINTQLNEIEDLDVIDSNLNDQENDNVENSNDSHLDNSSNDLNDKVELDNSNVVNNKEVNEVDPNPEFSYKEYARNNIVFLIDVSMSMEKEGRLEQLKIAMNHLTDMLRPEDYITIITYQTETKVVLNQVSAQNKEEIHDAINKLVAYGNTEGGKAIQTAYGIAKSRFVEEGNNQIILATDGGFRGLFGSENKLVNYIRLKSITSKVGFSVLCFGTNKDGQRMLKRLSNASKGSYMHVKDTKRGVEMLEQEIREKSRKK